MPVFGFFMSVTCTGLGLGLFKSVALELTVDGGSRCFAVGHGDK